MQLTVKGGRRQGRQRERWEDNIRKWTGLEFAKSQRAVENTEIWRKLVVKTFMCPNNPHSRAPKKNTGLRISHKDHVTNEEVCAKIQQAIGPYEDLLTIVKRI